MMKPRPFLLKVIALRQKLMDTKIGQRNIIESSMAIRILKPWLDAYPHATDQQVAAHIRRHYGAVQAIMPGGGAGNAREFQNQLNHIINHYAYAQKQA